MKRLRPPPPPAPPPTAAGPAPAIRRVAVIDLGATSIRMEVAELQPDGTARKIDALTRPISLGKDTFSSGMIRRETIEECVVIFRQFRQTLAEYGLTDMSAVRAVATSAVREAENRDQFLDRLYMATQIPVECLEDADLSRLTYVAVSHLLLQEGVRRPWNKLVVEIGGGSTEVLLIQEDRVTFSETYRLGSLRLRETLETYRAAPQRLRAILLQDIRRTAEEMKTSMPPLGKAGDVIAMSGDARFAASLLLHRWNETGLGVVRPRDFTALAHRLSGVSADELVRTYGISYPEAETVGPALLAYVEIVKTLGLRRILIPKISLRTALEIDLASNFAASTDFRRQIRHAAQALGERFQYDARHAAQVTDLSLQLFRALTAEHRLGPRHERLLETAALLHEIGRFINNRSHHKHSQYLIMNSDLFGVTQDDLLVISLVARYHRRSPPLPEHPFYGTLPREQRLVVQKLAAILRVADALDRGHTRRVRALDVRIEDARVVIDIPDVEDVTLERMALREKGRMFEDVYGKALFLNQVRSGR